MRRRNIIDPYNDQDYVEIGGIKWATKNVGASSVTDYGLYFQWGDISGYTAAQCGSGEGQKYFNWLDYKYNDGSSIPSSNNMTKYNPTDGKVTLDVSDDSAKINMGGNWRIPTKADFETLRDSVTTGFTDDYQGSGVAGLLCVSTDGKYTELFFPKVGFCAGGHPYGGGTYGSYWSRTLNGTLYTSAYRLYIYPEGVQWDGFYNRSYGFPIRGIIKD